MNKKKNKTLISYDSYEACILSVPTDVDEIRIDVNYLRDVFNVLNINELEINGDVIKISGDMILRIVTFVSRNTSVLYSKRSMEVDDQAELMSKELDIPMDLYISLNEQVLEKTIPQATAASKKLQKF